MIGGYGPERRGLRRWALMGLATASVLGGCGSTHSASTTAGPVFPNTPAGAQSRWLAQAINHLPISAAALRAHVSPSLLHKTNAAAINSGLVGAGQVRLVSVIKSEPRSIVYVISIRGGQRFRAALTVDANGLINSLPPTQELPSTASPQSMIPRLADGWVAEQVTFQAGGVTIYGTYTHPRSAAAGSIPAAVLLGGGGPTDRNDNCTSHCWTGPRPAGSPDKQMGRNALWAVANWLSADGVASLRYDHLGSGQTGWGKYAGHTDRVGVEPYEQEAVAALRFLAGQQQTNRARLAVVGHSQGGIHALALATGLAGNAPEVHAVVLLEPAPGRMLGFFAGSPAAARVIAYLRRTGTLPPDVPAAISNAFSANGTPLELLQLDRYDPADLAARLAPHTPVLLTCSNADVHFTCTQEDRIAAGLTQAQAKLRYVHLDGVDHMLKEDLSHDEAGFNEALPFSRQLQAELRTFAAENL